ncbi:MAG TPA: PorV/PorQ family protein [bacterium (Candidatus Stahlbacteria)]|nr:PorV/PorQ family protein [Candidatus Stahlbacteria bacterium]
MIKKFIVFNLLISPFFITNTTNSQIPEFMNKKLSKIGFVYMKLSPEAKGTALGGAYTSNSMGAASVYWNPARIFEQEASSINISYMRVFQGIDYESVFYSRNMGKNAVGIGMLGLFASGIELRDEKQELQGYYKVYDMALLLSYARWLQQGLCIGATIKTLYERIYIYSSRGWALDFALSYIPNPKLAFAFVMNNLGPMLKFNTEQPERIQLPFTVRGGLSFKHKDVTISFEVNKSVDAVLRANVGIEYNIVKYGEVPMLCLRAGYKIRYDTESLALGFGTKFGQFSLDYAYLPHSLNLGDSHIFTLGINL